MTNLTFFNFPKNKYFFILKYFLVALLFILLAFNFLNIVFILKNIPCSFDNSTFNYNSFPNLTELLNFIYFYSLSLFLIFKTVLFFCLHLIVKFYFNLDTIIDYTPIGDYFYNKNYIIFIIIISPFLFKSVLNKNNKWNNFINNLFKNLLFKFSINILLNSFKFIILISTILFIDCICLTLFNFSTIIFIVNKTTSVLTFLLNDKYLNSDVLLNPYKNINLDLINDFSIHAPKDEINKLAEDLSKTSRELIKVQRSSESTTIVVNNDLINSAVSIGEKTLNSPFNKSLPDGGAPSPNPEFNVHSMLDNLELSNWSFSFNIPTGDNSPLEGFLTTIHLSLIFILIISLYLAYLIIMQILVKNHSSFILNFLNNNLKFLPASLKSIIIKIIQNIINLHKRFYKYIIIILLFNLFYNILLCFFAVTYLIDNLDQFCEVYINHFKKN